MPSIMTFDTRPNHCRIRSVDCVRGWRFFLGESNQIESNEIELPLGSVCQRCNLPLQLTLINRGGVRTNTFRGMDIVHSLSNNCLSRCPPPLIRVSTGDNFKFDSDPSVYQQEPGGGENWVRMEVEEFGVERIFERRVWNCIVAAFHD